MQNGTGRFGKKATADEVLAQLDLAGRTILVTGCATGIGFETVRALAARGAHVIGTARSRARAADALAKVPGHTTPIACDQDDFASVAAAVEAVAQIGVRLDAVIANAGILAPPTPQLRYGVESQFRVNHLSHMLLVTRLLPQMVEGTGRVVVVSSSAAQSMTPAGGIDFDNLDAHAGYRPMRFYGQSKLANLTFAKTLARRPEARGISVHAIHPGVIAYTAITRSASPLFRLAMPFAGLFSKSIAQGAATQCYVATHPDLDGSTGGFYADCRPLRPNPKADVTSFQDRLWDVSEQILRRNAPETAQ